MVMGTSVSSPMPEDSDSDSDSPSNVYLDELSSLPHGLALWNPESHRVETIRNKVSIGDVGYFHEGTFIRLFNVLLSCHHISNRLPLNYPPYYYEPLDRNLLNITRSYFTRVQYYSRDVSAVTKAGINMPPDE